MKQYLLIIFFLSIIFSPPVSALGGFIGENPGLDFYTQIDESSASIHTQIINKHLANTPNLDNFAKGCPGAYALRWARTTSTTLDEIATMNYSSFSKITNENGQNSLSLDGFQALTACISGRYQWLKEQATDEQDSLESLSSIGLYSDGDTSNSDYDIVADIDKINTILFSTDLKYDGIKNNSKNSFGDFLSGKKILTIFEKKERAEKINTTVNPPESTPPKNDTVSDETKNDTNISDILWWSCVDPSKNTSPIAVADILDENFQRELDQALGTSRSNGNTSHLGGYTKPVGKDADTQAKKAPKTSKDDFFDTLPCNDVFCVKVAIKKWGNDIRLTGGKNYSIEGILDKHKNILYPIANSSLRSEKMTNNFWSLPFANMKLSSLIGGGRIYIASRPQPTRTTPVIGSTEKAFDDARLCAFLAAGLAWDPIQANGMGWGGFFRLGNGITSENLQTKDTKLWPQDTSTNSAGCMQKMTDSAREKYYQSFANNLTQIQAFTRGFIDEIDEVMSVGTALYTKPVN